MNPNYPDNAQPGAPDAPWNYPDEPEYTCEDCEQGFDHEDDGYLTDAGFECHTCYSKRHDEEMRRFLASDYYRIRKNYPTLDRDVQHMKDDPAGFYNACKNDPDSLYRD